jgi:hypothetical protein
MRTPKTRSNLSDNRRYLSVNLVIDIRYSRWRSSCHDSSASQSSSLLPFLFSSLLLSYTSVSSLPLAVYLSRHISSPGYLDFSHGLSSFCHLHLNLTAILLIITTLHAALNNHVVSLSIAVAPPLLISILLIISHLVVESFLTIASARGSVITYKRGETVFAKSRRVVITGRVRRQKR